MVLSLMTYEKPCITQDTGQAKGQETKEGNLDGIYRMEIGSLGSCYIKGASGIETEEIPIIDQRLKLAWKHNIFRTLISFQGTSLEIMIPRD